MVNASGWLAKASIGGFCNENFSSLLYKMSRSMAQSGVFLEKVGSLVYI